MLDLGCGRGEFTELLTENGIDVTGVDQYGPYVEYMKMKQLPVVLDDAIHYLEGQQKVGGIFLGQVIEHISVEQVIRLLELAYEKLEKDACLIMETPNPKSVAIYTECFYIDPSHQRPVHPYTLKYLAEKVGFKDVSIKYTESSRMSFHIPELKMGDNNLQDFNDAMAHVSEVLYGSQDYALIERK